MTPEMIPVGGVNNAFVLQFRIASFEFAYDVVRFELSNLLLDLDTSFGIQRHRPKIFRDGSFLERLEILPAIGDYFFCNFQRDSGTRRHSVYVFVWIIQLA